MDLKTYLETNTQTDLALRLGVSQGLIHQWLSGKTRITAERAKEIERVTDRQVTRRELRPDIFDDDDINAEPADDVQPLRRATDTHNPHGEPHD